MNWAGRKLSEIFKDAIVEALQEGQHVEQELHNTLKYIEDMEALTEMKNDGRWQLLLREAKGKIAKLERDIITLSSDPAGNSNRIIAARCVVTALREILSIPVSAENYIKKEARKFNEQLQHDGEEGLPLGP